MHTKSPKKADRVEAAGAHNGRDTEVHPSGDERFRMLLETTNAVPWEADARTWQFIYVGPRAVKLLGYPIEAWFEDDFWPAHIHPEDREQAVAYCLEASRSHEDYEFEYRMIAADGRIVWLHDIVNVVLEKGEPRTLRGFLIDITERKRAEESLRGSEARFRTVASSTTDIIYEWDVLADSVQFFGDVDACLGYAAGEFPRNYEGWESSLHPDDRDRVLRLLEECLHTGAAFDGEYRMRTKDGTYRFWRDRGAAVSWENSKPTNWIGACTDITERKRAEEALIESEEQLRLLIDSLPVFISYVDRDLRYRIDNKAYEAWFGSSVTGLHVKEVLGDTVFEHTLPYVERALAGEMVKYDSTIPARDGGQSRDASVSFVPDFDDEGQTKGFFALISDVTERKQREEALRNALSEVAHLKDQFEAENIYLKEEIKLEHNFEEIVGTSDSLMEVLHKAETVAATDTTVLVLGETGTGKELLARAIHNLSARKERPLVKVDCAALPPTLIESELFGHEKGAFTGASSRQIGRFELADGGTIFLDEIGDIPFDLQTKLLRVLQEGEFERIGNPRTVKADVRIIAATNQDLAAAVRQGNFRADLYYRLNVFPLYIPPLRERRDDIPLLVRWFASKFAKHVGKEIETIPQPAMDSLQAYDWPGNVRELENVVERAVIVSRGSVLRLADRIDGDRVLETEPVNGQTLVEVEREHIKRVLKDSGWRIEGPGGAALALGLNAGTLRSRLRKLGIGRPNEL